MLFKEHIYNELEDLIRFDILYSYADKFMHFYANNLNTATSL